MADAWAQHVWAGDRDAGRHGVQRVARETAGVVSRGVSGGRRGGDDQSDNDIKWAVAAERTRDGVEDIERVQRLGDGHAGGTRKPGGIVESARTAHGTGYRRADLRSIRFAATARV